VASVTIQPNPWSILTGDTQQFTAIARDAAGTPLPGRSVTWTTSNAGVAIVDSTTGVATGVAGGTATLSATVDGKTGAAMLTVSTPGVGLGLEQFSLIPAGTFQMGSNSGVSSETPVHTVTISRAFYLQRTEVTQAQWSAVMGTNVSYPASCGDTCPVDLLHWNDIQTFLQRLNASTQGVTYRLPAEAEWEYAARAGTTADTYGALDAIAWYDSNSAGKMHPVAGKQANAWGLYDMIGNVWEWVSDWYDSSYYAVSPTLDPPGPTSGATRVLRGGAWNRSASVARAASRNSNYPAQNQLNYGFRLVRTQ
jgi:formylglycine-generating enzyme required for sulfatase activity